VTPVATVTTATGELAVPALDAMRPKRVTVYHDGRKLVGFLLARGDENEPYRVELRPWATLVGRVVDAQGKPRPKVRMMTSDWQGHTDDASYGFLPGELLTDDQGRFRIERLVPGQTYSASVVGTNADEDYGALFTEIVLKPGETKDLGDVGVAPRKPAEIQ
jgi:hypothetical protein